jgi:dCTP deaminase
MPYSRASIKDNFRTGAWKAFRSDKRLEPAEIDALRIGPNSIDVTLHQRLLLPESNQSVINPLYPESLHWQEALADQFLLSPGGFVLGAVNERFDVGPDVQHVTGRSTCGRIGLGVHVTAGFGDVGFTGAFTLEIFNAGPFPIVLHTGMRIAQVFFEPVVYPGWATPSYTYTGAYSTNSHNDGPVAPVLGKDRF